MRSQNTVCLQSITPVWPPAAFPKGDSRNISECKEHLPSKFKAMEVMLSVWARARKAIPPCASSWSFQLLKPFRSYQFPIFGRNNSVRRKYIHRRDLMGDATSEPGEK
ncbi:unnamed protein product [Rangifer tarandus platyrhynchus]|uniref:Uncharacterized protein n=2 Tax=Rangifer tarandus platyrhynchus TaxID=3082113 RepID=A0ABN8ZEU9_RANTA|nr:unnamed protein product [Rangifer tarandus platyrhynchus]